MARFEASNPKPQSSNDFRAAAVGGVTSWRAVGDLAKGAFTTGFVCYKVSFSAMLAVQLRRIAELLSDKAAIPVLLFTRPWHAT